VSTPPRAGRSVGIDLGGTSVKLGALDLEGAPIDSLSFPTELDRGPADLARRMAEAARALGVEGSLGLAAPGLLERGRGVVTASPNLAPIEGFPLRDELARLLGFDPRRVRFENDANAAAVGEHCAGAARGEHSFAMATLGTGVGGGILLEDRLVIGEGGLAGELGHVVIDPRGPRCGCGGRGCLEQYASASAAARRAREAGLEPDPVRLTALARGGAGPERDLLSAIGRDLGRGLAPLVTLIDLRCFVIGGGFGAAFELLLPGLVEGLLERTFGRRPGDFRLYPATLGGDAGWIGAARLGRQTLSVI
jgi:glucokinase